MIVAQRKKNEQRMLHTSSCSLQIDFSPHFMVNSLPNQPALHERMDLCAKSVIVRGMRAVMWSLERVQVHVLQDGVVT